MKRILITVKQGDAFNFEADSLVLKYARVPFGLDRDIIREFETLGFSISNKLPEIWDCLFTDSKKITKTKNILFIGTPRLTEFEYKEINLYVNNTVNSNVFGVTHHLKII